MAQNTVRMVQLAADRQASDPVRAHIEQMGKVGSDAAYFGACMALVSLAEDARRIADHLTGKGAGNGQADA